MPPAILYGFRGNLLSRFGDKTICVEDMLFFESGFWTHSLPSSLLEFLIKELFIKVLEIFDDAIIQWLSMGGGIGGKIEEFNIPRPERAISVKVLRADK